MKITMLETRKGSPDGIRVLEYERDVTYDVTADLGRVFVEQGWAKEVTEKRELKVKFTCGEPGHEHDSEEEAGECARQASLTVVVPSAVVTAAVGKALETEFRPKLEAMKVAELHEFIKEAGMESPPKNANKAALVEHILAQAKVGPTETKPAPGPQETK